MISVEKPGTPQELVHFGVKGMRWGVRRERASPGVSGQPKQGMSTKKKVAIGVGVGAVVAGGVATAIILKKTGNLPVSPFSNRHPHDVGKILETVGDKRPSRWKVSTREYKRYHRDLTTTREWRARMKSLELQAGRNMAIREKAAAEAAIRAKKAAALVPPFK